MVALAHYLVGAAGEFGYTGGAEPPPPPPPPPPVSTIFGINTNEHDTFQQTRAGREALFGGRLPMVRRYTGTVFPSTWPVSVAVAPEKRCWWSFKSDDWGGPLDAAALAAGAGNARFRSLLQSIPAGWDVVISPYHEVNDNIRDYNAGVRKGKVLSAAHFRGIFAQLYPVLQEAVLAPGTRVRLMANFMAYNLTRTGTGPDDPNAFFHDLWVPAHGTMDALSWDIYGNPGVNTRQVTGPGYGTSYPNVVTRAADMLAITNRLGWGGAWAIGELNSPARDWDVDESARATWHKQMIEHLLGQPTPPEVLLPWEAPSGVNWDQAYGRVSGNSATVANVIKPYILATPVGG